MFWSSCSSYKLQLVTFSVWIVVDCWSGVIGSGSGCVVPKGTYYHKPRVRPQLFERILGKYSTWATALLVGFGAHFGFSLSLIILLLELHFSLLSSLILIILPFIVCGRSSKPHQLLYKMSYNS